MGLLQGVSLQLKPGWGFSFIFILKEENLPEQAVSVVVSHFCPSCPCIFVPLSQYKFLLHMTTHIP